jgi:hypothetical protein
MGLSHKFQRVGRGKVKQVKETRGGGIGVKKRRGRERKCKERGNNSMVKIYLESFMSLFYPQVQNMTFP